MLIIKLFYSVLYGFYFGIVILSFFEKKYHFIFQYNIILFYSINLPNPPSNTDRQFSIIEFSNIKRLFKFRYKNPPCY